MLVLSSAMNGIDSVSWWKKQGRGKPCQGRIEEENLQLVSYNPLPKAGDLVSVRLRLCLQIRLEMVNIPVSGIGHHRNDDYHVGKGRQLTMSTRRSHSRSFQRVR